MQRYRYTWFLLSLIAMITLAPITERGAIADIAHQILFTSIVLLALNAATERRGRQVAVAVCAVSWLIMDWFDFLAGSAQFRIPAGIAFFCLLFVMLYALLTQLLRVRQTDFDLLSAAVAAYFLLGVAWAASFDVIEQLLAGLIQRGGRAAVVGSPVLQHGDADLGRLRRHHPVEFARRHLGNARGCLRRALHRRADLAPGQPDA